MIRIGITGLTGFIGSHLANTLLLYPEEFTLIPFKDSFFSNITLLRGFVQQCDVIVHLAAMNRHPDPAVIFETNIQLVNRLIEAMLLENVTPQLLFSSSTQEENNTTYGNSKREGRLLFNEWALSKGASFTGLIVPNVYGPFGRPNYNSFISTFCYKLTRGETPEVVNDSLINLIYIGNLCNYILNKIRSRQKSKDSVVECDYVPFDFEKKVTEVLQLLQYFKNLYFDQGCIPKLNDNNEINLFNTFRSYIDYPRHFPVQLVQHSDPRGIFVETLKLGVGGQVSFSTTLSGITRGNHYHTRKIERFTVIKGKARIQLRKIGSNEVFDFFLDGNTPSYVDIPIWHTHNISNIGEDDLYTLFWINEWYNPGDSDTYFENV